MSFVCAIFNFLIFFKKLFYHQFLIPLVHVDLCSSSHNDFFNSCSFFLNLHTCIYIKELVVKQYVYIKSKWHNATKCLFTMKYAWFFCTFLQFFCDIPVHVFMDMMIWIYYIKTCSTPKELLIECCLYGGF